MGQVTCKQSKETCSYKYSKSDILLLFDIDPGYFEWKYIYEQHLQRFSTRFVVGPFWHMPSLPHVMA